LDGNWLFDGFFLLSFFSPSEVTVVHNKENAENGKSFWPLWHTSSLAQ
jgi:hypothetical protein